MKRILLGVLALLWLPSVLAEELVLDKEFWVLRDGIYHTESISVMPDGAMLVAANNWGKRQGVVAKIDKDGREIWRYMVQQQITRPSLTASAIGQATVGTNGNTLICAFENPTDWATGDRKAHFILLDRDGQLLREHLLVPHGQPVPHIGKITNCGSWGDSFYALSEASLPSNPRAAMSDEYAWVVRLNEKGDIEWDQLIKLQTGAATVSTPQVMPGGDLLIAVAGWGEHAELTNLAILSPDGTILRQNVLPVQQRVVEAVDQARVPLSLGDNATMLRLGPELDVVSEREVSSSLSKPPFAFLDRSDRLTTFWERKTPLRGTVRFVTRAQLQPFESRNRDLPTTSNSRYSIEAVAKIPGEDAFLVAFDARSNSLVTSERIESGVTISRVRFVP